MTIDKLAFNIETELSIFREAMAVMTNKIQGMEVRLDTLGQRMGALEQRFDVLEQRMSIVEKRIESLEKSMDRGFAVIMQELKNMPGRTEFVDMKIRMDKWDRKFGAQI